MMGSYVLPWFDKLLCQIAMMTRIAQYFRSGQLDAMSMSSYHAIQGIGIS